MARQPEVVLRQVVFLPPDEDAPFSDPAAVVLFGFRDFGLPDDLQIPVRVAVADEAKVLEAARARFHRLAEDFVSATQHWKR